MKYLTGLSQFQHMLKAIRNDNYLVSMLQYALNSGDERRQSLEHILQMLSNATPKHKDQIMNVAERLRNEYKPQFIAEGVQQGIEKGIEKVAKNMLLAGESVEKVSRFTGLSETHLSQIE